MAKRRADLRKLAQRQRWIIWLVLASLISYLAPFYLRGELGVIIFALGGVIYLGIYILMIVGVVLLLIAKGSHPVVITLLAILMAAPCVNLVVLILINMGVTRMLRAAGLRVGFMGADPDEVEHILNPDLCSHCGYNHTGNVTGVCSECGQAI